jgi:hypothetical protein
MSLINICIAIAMIFEHVPSALFLLIMHMIVYGGSFISPAWAYPSEVIPASNALIPNITQWSGMAVTTLIPPLVSGAMPKNNPYPVFLVLGVYGFLSLIHVYRVLKESDGKTYN